MTAPRLADVHTSTIALRATTRCEMPNGRPCPWAPLPSTLISPAAARQHALEFPGHYVVRDTVSRTRWVLDPTDTPGG